MRPTAQLRHLLAGDEILVAPGAHDAWSGRLIQHAGFSAVYMTGFGAAASRLGVPDLGILTATEMADHAARITGAVDLPVIADADNGFGDVLNVQRTMRMYEAAGVAAIQIEDQVSPKRCGHMDSKQIIDTKQMVRHIRATIDARTDPDLVVIARTDARTVKDFDEALRRAETYLEAGADMLFVESPLSDSELIGICRRFEGVPLLANMAPGCKTPYHSASELQSMGFSLVIYPIDVLLAATAAMQAALTDLRTHGRLVEGTPFIEFKNFLELVDLEGYIRSVNKYA